jgi:hypothetical protein
MKKALVLGAAAYAVAAIAFTTAPYAAQCIENGVIVSCPPDAKLSFQQQAAAPNSVQPPLQLEPNQTRPSEIDPGRYPGPSLTSEGGDGE